MQRRNIWGGVLIAMLLHASLAYSVQAIGVSPPSIEAPQVLRGIGQEASINIGRLPSEVGDLTIQVGTRGDYAAYLKYEPTFIIPAEKSSVNYTFTIDGATAPVGTYQVPMTFSLITTAASPVEGGGPMMSVITGATIMVNFTVTGDQVVSYTLGGIEISSVESDDNVFLSFGFTNTGNVDWKPEGATVTFTNEEDTTQIFTAAVSGDQFSMIRPGETDAQEVEITQQLPEGSYHATADISYGGASVGTMSSQSFSVVAPGSLLQAGELLGAEVPKDSFALGEHVPVNGTFVNTGEVPLRGIFTVEVEHDGVYEDLVLGEEFMIGVGETTDVSVIVDPKESGSYTLKSYVKFANRKSNIIDIPIVVTSSGGDVLGFFNSPVGLGVLIGGILLLVGTMILIRRRSHRVHEVSAPQVATVSSVSAPIPVSPLTSPVVQPPSQPPTPVAPVAPSPSVPTSEQPKRRW